MLRVPRILAPLDLPANYCWPGGHQQPANRGLQNRKNNQALLRQFWYELPGRLGKARCERSHCKTTNGNCYGWCASQIFLSRQRWLIIWLAARRGLAHAPSLKTCWKPSGVCTRRGLGHLELYQNGSSPELNLTGCVGSSCVVSGGVVAPHRGGAQASPRAGA